MYSYNFNARSIRMVLSFLSNRQQKVVFQKQNLDNHGAKYWCTTGLNSRAVDIYSYIFIYQRHPKCTTSREDKPVC